MLLRKSLTSLALAVTIASLASAQTIQINRENKTIAISTADEATAIANIAAITVGFQIYGPDSESTYAHAGKLSQAILQALHKAGIEDKSIESSAQGLQRNTNFDDKDTAEFRAQHQFIFNQSWTVSVSPKQAAQVIRVAIAAGANQSGNIDWRLSDRKALQAKAAQAALVKARAVAGQMAEGLHVKLGDLIYASNETPNARIYFAHPSQDLVLNTSSASVGSFLVSPILEIRPQTIREEATVYAVFAIE
ncbi:MAG TPA: SIMPL domain-containing protein [Terracidiphilus sp.]|nr:SIMPL domain-containing protein [Terracidiphilus sp.]